MDSVTNNKMADSKLARTFIVQLGRFVSIAFVIMLTLLLSDITKLNEILKVLKFYNFPEARWLDFGLNLGLLHPTLEAIESVYGTRPSRCLMECLTKWLSKVDKTVRPLTWQTLANAARGMNAIAVADNIQKTSKSSNTN